MILPTPQDTEVQDHDGRCTADISERARDYVPQNQWDEGITANASTRKE
jgi:hypothetical protein